MTGDVDLAALYEQTRAEVERGLTAVGWVEDEIEQAAKRHPDQADLLHHAFTLAQPTAGMGVEFVVRGHAREMLDRVAVGDDTRPGTAAEVCMVCSRASLIAPFTTAAVGLYLRMWEQAFPDHPIHDGVTSDRTHYEALRSPDIDDLERMTRRKASVPGRRLGDVVCGGQHHGDPTVCRFITPTVPAPRRPADDWTGALF